MIIGVREVILLGGGRKKFALKTTTLGLPWQTEQVSACPEEQSLP